jgi:hypothetical protein
MVFKFKIISDKVEDFVLHIEADAKNTFFELHETLQEQCRYDPSELATFFLADEEWDKGDEIKMFNERTLKQKPLLLMKHTDLGDCLKKEEDKLIYIFDVSNHKSLYIELTKIIMEDKLSTPIVTYNRGIAPAQGISNRYNSDLLADQDLELQNVFTDFGELEDLNMIYGEIGEVM